MRLKLNQSSPHSASISPTWESYGHIWRKVATDARQFLKVRSGQGSAGDFGECSERQSQGVCGGTRCSIHSAPLSAAVLWSHFRPNELSSCERYSGGRKLWGRVEAESCGVEPRKAGAFWQEGQMDRQRHVAATPIAESVRRLEALAHPPTLGRHRDSCGGLVCNPPDVDQKLPKFGQCWSNAATCRPSLLNIGQSKLAQSRQDLAEADDA